jgi:hypothetical protein
MRIRQGGAFRNVQRGLVRVGGQWRPMTRAVTYVSGQWKQVAVFTQPVTLSITPESVSGFIVGGGTATTNAATATPSGGLAPFTYSWTQTFGSGAGISSPSAATTTFSLAISPNDFQTATFQCVVTDSLGSAATANVNATFFSTTFD